MVTTSSDGGDNSVGKDNYGNGDGDGDGNGKGKWQCGEDDVPVIVA